MISGAEVNGDFACATCARAPVWFKADHFPHRFSVYQNKQVLTCLISIVSGVAVRCAAVRSQDRLGSKADKKRPELQLS